MTSASEYFSHQLANKLNNNRIVLTAHNLDPQTDTDFECIFRGNFEHCHNNDIPNSSLELEGRVCFLGLRRGHMHLC